MYRSNILDQTEEVNPSQLSNQNSHRSRNPLHPPLPLPPKPAEIQKQVMKETLMKYREAVSEFSGRKGEEEEESVLFDLSRSMSEIEDSRREENEEGKEIERDEELERLYEERKEIIEELGEIEKELEELEEELGS